MNVLHLQLSGGFGGISVLCRDISKYSKNNNYFYFLFEGGTVADEIKSSGSVVEIKNGKGNSFLQNAKELKHYCKENKIDVIVNHTDSPIVRALQIYAKKHIKNIRLILYLHCNAKFELHYDGIKQKICKMILTKAFQVSDYAVAISDSVKKSYTDALEINQDKIKRIYNGVDLTKFHHNSSVNDIVKFVYVGRLYDFKGIDLLIDAFNDLNKNIDFSLNLFGKGEDEYVNHINQKIKDNNLEKNIKLMGTSNDIPSALCDCDYFIHPAICEEGFGLTLIEAFASSVPVIAFNKGAIPEIIDDGVDGYITNDISPNGLAKSIEKAYALFCDKESYFEMCKNAKNKASNFSIEKMIAELESLY